MMRPSPTFAGCEHDEPDAAPTAGRPPGRYGRRAGRGAPEARPHRPRAHRARARCRAQLRAVRRVNVAGARGGERLKRVLTVRALTAIGLGATIGTGIFVLT